MTIEIYLTTINYLRREIKLFSLKSNLVKLKFFYFLFYYLCRLMIGFIPINKLGDSLFDRCFGFII